VTDPFPIERITRLDLQPDEVLAVTVGWDDLTMEQIDDFGQLLATWLTEHGVRIAGVVILPKGSKLAAINASDEIGPCETCGTPYSDCEISADTPDYTTDANGNHDGLCCEDCQHPGPPQ
jgi:hypothetical protein